jgi:hypothetical protein
MPKEWWEDEYHVEDTSDFSNNSSPRSVRTVRYKTHVPIVMVERVYSDEEKMASSDM